MKQHRLARLNEAVREVASEAILFELRDPRIKFVTVTRAEVSPDLQHAKIYVSVMGSEQDRKLTMHGLSSAAGFVQSKLADRMTSRYVPAVRFYLDEGMRNSMQVSELLAKEKLSKNDDPVAESDEIDDDESDDRVESDDDQGDEVADTIGDSTETPQREGT
jgi:ribosome-binding factor A